MIFIMCASLLVLIVMTIIAPANTLDARLYYNQLEAWSYFVSLGANDAARYFLNELLDLAFIFLYSAFLSISFERLTNWSKSSRRLVFVPGAFDLIETVWILGALKTGNIAGPVLWVGVATFLKWTTGLIVVICLLVGWVRKKQAQAAVQSIS